MDESQMIMAPSAAGMKLTRDFEGCKLVAYPDPATGGIPWTIGVGHTGPDVYQGLCISFTQALRLYRYDTNRCASTVNRWTSELKLTQGQFDALVDLVFNVGRGGFERSLLLAKLKANDVNGAAAEFLNWDHDRYGRVVPGLKRRREAEYRMFTS